MKLLLVAGVLAPLSACSILYNPNNVPDPKIDAAIDVAVDTPIDMPADAAIDMPADSPFDAPMLTVTTATPSVVAEGTGSGNSRPQLILIDGTNLISPTVTIDQIDDGGQQKQVPIIGMRVAASGTRIALAVQVPVLTATAQNATKPMHLHVAQLGFTADVDVTISGLDELAPSGTFDAANLRAQYSRATFSSATHFVGTPPALVRVTSDITVSAPVDVDGVGTTPGAHGCTGGGEGLHGNCGVGGGAAGTSGGDGGGGGFGTTGTPASATAGALTGDPLLLSLTTTPGTAGNRGNGGGGGAQAVTGNGGPGGAGAGVLELTADGSITVSGAGTLRAKGGNGGAGGALGGGTGGGGSGGAILVRAGAGIAATGAWASAPGGTGGGAGGQGRIRIDTTAAIPGTPAPAPARGVAWTTTAPTISPTAMVDVPLIGAPSTAYGIYLNGAQQANAMTAANGTGMATVTLTAGMNTLCATTTPTTAVTIAEATRCIQIAYVP